VFEIQFTLDLNQRRPEQTTSTERLPFTKNIIPLFTFSVRYTYLVKYLHFKKYMTVENELLKYIFKYIYQLRNGYCKCKHEKPNATVTCFRV